LAPGYTKIKLDSALFMRELAILSADFDVQKIILALKYLLIRGNSKEHTR
jgi:hypothetical protein